MLRICYLMFSMHMALQIKHLLEYLFKVFLQYYMLKNARFISH